jgi:hypothetical protein
MSRTEPSRRRVLSSVFVLSMIASVAVAGCSSVFSGLPPQLGGLPEGTPGRSAELPTFPAVNDLPPKRSEPMLSAAERQKVEAELAAARDDTVRAAEGDSQADTGKAKAAATAAAKSKTAPAANGKLEAKAEPKAEAAAR